MADWVSPVLYDVSDGDLSVGAVIDDVIVDMSGVDDPSDVRDLEELDESSGISFDISGSDVTRVSMSLSEFKALVEGTEASEEDILPAVSSSDPDDGVVALAVDDTVQSSSSFSPQTWQLNMAQNRPIGWHYVMSRVGSYNNHYILVLGRDINFSNGLYTYVDCDQYSVYQTGSGSAARYVYDVNDHATGNIDSSSYVVYSDLFFDYVGSRSVSYSWLFIAFLVVIVLFIIVWRGKRKT